MVWSRHVVALGDEMGDKKKPSQAGALHDGVEQLDLASEGGLSPITS